MAGHAQLKFVMTECSKTQIHLTRHIYILPLFQVFKPTKKDFQPKYKMKGKSRTGKFEQRKKGVLEEDRRAQLKERLKLKQQEDRQKLQNESRTLLSGNVLDRFKRKDT